MKNLIVLLFFALLGQGSGQTKIATERESKIISGSTFKKPTETSDGIIYFSYDKGLRWQNKSNGLPATTSLGLGAIAVSNSSLGIATKDNGVYLFDVLNGLWVSIPTDKKVIDNNLGALFFYKGGIYAGTQHGGIFYSVDKGNSWHNLNAGLHNLTIRRFAEINQKLFVATNAGLYSYNELQHKWKLEFGNATLQVNGIVEFDGNIYIGTNQGVFTNSVKEWKSILANQAVHNISSDENTIYAMTYNELLSSMDKGKTWQNIQSGLPPELYTFNVVRLGSSIFAGQWDGVYRKDKADGLWRSYSNGLPEKFAITNMKLYNGIIVVSGSERKLNGQ